MASSSGSTIRVDIEDGLAIGLVETGEAAPGVDRLELGRGDRLGLPVRPGVGGAVEPTELVVEGPSEPAAQRARARGQLGGRLESDPFEVVVEGHRAGDGRAVGQSDLDVAHRKLDGVEHDLPDRLVDHGVDRHRARKAGRTEVRLDLDAIRSPARRCGAGETQRYPVRQRTSSWEGASGEGYPPRSE